MVQTFHRTNDCFQITKQSKKCFIYKNHRTFCLILFNFSGKPKLHLTDFIKYLEKNNTKGKIYLKSYLESHQSFSSISVITTVHNYFLRPQIFYFSYYFEYVGMYNEDFVILFLTPIIHTNKSHHNIAQNPLF